MTPTDSAIHAIGIDRDYYREQLEMKKRDLAATSAMLEISATALAGATRYIEAQSDRIAEIEVSLKVTTDELAEVSRQLDDAHVALAALIAERRAA